MIHSGRYSSRVACAVIALPISTSVNITTVVTPRSLSFATMVGACSCALEGSPTVVPLLVYSKDRVRCDLPALLLDLGHEPLLEVEHRRRVHDADHAVRLLQVRAPRVLRLLPDELLADELARVHRDRDLIGLAPAVRLLLDRLVGGGRVRHHEVSVLRDLRGEHVEPGRRGLEHGERLVVLDAQRVGALRGLVVARRLHELQLDRATPRLVRRGRTRRRGRGARPPSCPSHR